MNPGKSIISAGGMVSCPHRLATEAGVAMLRAGGSAVDAAIATNAALGVVYPHMSGIGGDAFALIYDCTQHQLLGLNGSGHSAAAATPDLYRAQGLEAIPQRGPLAALTVPGAVAAWAQAHQRLGRLSWETLLQPAIDLAQEGYAASESQCRWSRQDAADLRRYSGAVPFLPDGQPPSPGQILQNPDQARTLEQLAAGGAAEFYTGAIATALTDHLQSIGSPLTAADFAAAQADWVEPISTPYRGRRIWQLPPNSQGFTLLQILNLIEPYNLPTLGHGSADYYHLMVEATKLAFCDRNRWLGDPDFTDIPTAELISKSYAEGRRAALRLDRAQDSAAPPIGGDTVYSAFVDAAGNAVSWIQSLYFDFGSAVVVPGTGVVLQNRGSFFTLEPGHPNSLAPRKRPFHTLMPAMATDDAGQPELVFGTMGGEGQPQTQLALITRLLDYGFDPQAAVDLPRWLWGRTWGAASSGLQLENTIDSAVAAELETRGHAVRRVAPGDAMGHASVIRIAASGQRQGGCDPRSDGAALGT